MEAALRNHTLEAKQPTSALTVGRILLLSLPYAWISVFNSVLDNGLPVILTAPLSDGGLAMSFTAKGVVMALDNILGLLLMPIFGKLSDNSKNKHGKRTPFILVGGIGALVSWLVTGYFLGLSSKWMFLIFLTSGLTFIALSRPASLALLPDFAAGAERRKANAITQIVSIVCTVVGILLISVLTPISYHVLFYGTAAVMVILVVLYAVFVKETEWAKQQTQDTGEDDAVTGAASNYNRIVLLVTVFFFYVAYNGLVSSLSNYATDVLNLSKQKFVLPQAITLLMACLFAVPVAKLSNRLKRRTMLLSGMILMLVAFVTAGLQPGLNTLMFCSFALVGLGFSAVIVNLYPCMLEFSDPNKIGSSTAIFNTTMTVAMVLTPIASGALADRFGMRSLFPYCIAALILALISLFLIKETKTTKEAA